MCERNVGGEEAREREEERGEGGTLLMGEGCSEWSAGPHLYESKDPAGEHHSQPSVCNFDFCFSFK